MENQNYNTELDWNDTIEDDGSEFVTVPVGEYQFTITNMERGRFPGSPKLAPCNKATLTLRLAIPKGICSFKSDILLSKGLEWRIAQFFRSIGFTTTDGKLKMDWDHVIGKAGRAKVKVRKYTTNSGEEREVNEIDTYLPYDESKMSKAAEPQWEELKPDEELPF